MRKIKSQSLSGEVKNEIFHYIKNNFSGTDNKLPTEEQFSEMLGVSRITVRTALNTLANDGIIFRRQGRGTFVNPQALSMKVPFNPVTLFREMIRQCGFHPSVKLLPTAVIKAGDKLSKELNVSKESEIVFTRKIFYADKHPCAYCEDFFSIDILKERSEQKRIEDFPNSLFEFLKERCGRKIEWDRTEILTVTNREAEQLTEAFSCQDEVRAFLLLESLNFDDKDLPVVWAKEFIDTNYIRFNSIRQKHIH